VFGLDALVFLWLISLVSLVVNRRPK